jgi:hypothetical protein
MMNQRILNFLILGIGCIILLNSLSLSGAHSEDIFSNDKKSITALPPSFNWCDIDGINYTTPIKNQAPCPSCEAYAVVATLETLVQYEVGYPFGCDLSEMHLFLHSGGTCQWGVRLLNCTQYLHDYGVPDEGCFPDPRRDWDTPLNETLSGWENRTVKIKNWGWVDVDIDTIKQALIDYGPLIICVIVRTDFMWYKGGIYRNLWGKIEGGHVVTIVGYDDSQNCWLIKNSWGTEWGENGWMRVSYNAHKSYRQFFYGFYGGTGILYIDGVYGNFQPDVPKIHIENPKWNRLYFDSFTWKKSFLRKFFIKSTEAIIIKGTTVQLDVSNDTEYVEVYVDNKLIHSITEPPFEWCLICEDYDVHELKFIAYNKNNASKDIQDVITIPLKANT